VHEGQVVVTCLDDGAIRFTRPGGKTFDSPVPLTADWRELVEPQSIRITPQTAITGWSGEALDIDQAVGWLLQRADRAKSVSAETSP
jgi:hypothetical protein